MPYRIALLACLAVFTCSVHAVTPAELAANPLWMPAETSITQDLSFSDGKRARKGVNYRIFALEGDQLRLWFPDGRSTFNIAVAQTKLVEDAEARLKKMSPAQRELSTAALVERSELWPLQVKLVDTVTYDNGSRLTKNSQMTVTSFDGTQVQVYEPRKNALYNVNVSITDFFDRCLENADAPRPSRLYQELAATVVAPDTLKPIDFFADGGPEYLAIYHAADWCPYCAQTSPEVMKWYRENQAREKKQIEMILVSHDKSRAEMTRHIKALQFQSPLVPFDKLQAMILLRNTPESSGLPDLFVVDRTGAVVLPSTADQPMERINDMLSRMRALQAKLDAEAGS